jgi:thiol-disulfide isomerase/thioredoxin
LKNNQPQDVFYFKNSAAEICARLNQLDKFKEFTKDIPISKKASMYNNVAWQFALENKNLPFAKSLSEEVTMWAKSQMNNPSEDKPLYQTKKEWHENLTGQYKMFGDTYAYILYLLKDYEKGFAISKEVAVDLAKKQDAPLNNTYALLLEKIGTSSQVKKELEEMVQSGTASAKVKEILKKVYRAEKKSESGYDAYLAKLEEASKIKKKEELTKEMLDEKAPLFKLMNLDGQQINLQDLKGKVVIVDFWATWCGPCKASFPGMQKAVNKYKNAPDVAFVFIDTWEQGDDREKKVKEFIAKNKYSFNVLYDISEPGEENTFTVVSDYKVEGIPTKFIIDKNGMIRFKKVGFDGSDDNLVSEIETMIELAGK